MLFFLLFAVSKIFRPSGGFPPRILQKNVVLWAISPKNNKKCVSLTTSDQSRGVLSLRCPQEIFLDLVSSPTKLCYFLVVFRCWIFPNCHRCPPILPELSNPVSTRLTRGARPALADFQTTSSSSQWLLLKVMLQLIEPKFRPHPSSFASRPTLYVLYLLPPRQGNRSRTVGEGRNNVPNWFARCDFHLEFHLEFYLVFSVTNIHTIRLP